MYLGCLFILTCYHLRSFNTTLKFEAWWLKFNMLPKTNKQTCITLHTMKLCEEIFLSIYSSWYLHKKQAWSVLSTGTFKNDSKACLISSLRLSCHSSYNILYYFTFYLCHLYQWFSPQLIC